MDTPCESTGLGLIQMGWTQHIEMRISFISQDLWDIVQDGYKALANEEDLATWKEACHKKNKEIQKRDANALLNLQRGESKSIFPRILAAKTSKGSMGDVRV